MAINLVKKAQIKVQVQVKALLFNKTHTKVANKYFNYSNVFSAENIAKLPKNFGINDHAIKLKKNKQPYFGLIYSLEPIELKMLITYIKTNLANSFIRFSKSSARVPIPFNQKRDRNLWLCVYY